MKLEKKMFWIGLIAAILFLIGAIEMLTVKREPMPQEPRTEKKPTGFMEKMELYTLMTMEAEEQLSKYGDVSVEVFDINKTSNSEKDYYRVKTYVKVTNAFGKRHFAMVGAGIRKGQGDWDISELKMKEVRR